MNVLATRLHLGAGLCLSAILMMAAPLAATAASPNDNPAIEQSRGADAQLDYASLTRFGPWDDRNYQLTRSDLSWLADNESELHPGIPAFFRVELRKEWPHLMRTGAAQYPRAARQVFKIRYGGLMRNGRTIGGVKKSNERVPVPVNGELQLNQVLGANEATVEINPANPSLAIAGSNNNGGQEMYYSTNGGETWTIQGVLSDTCCDPTVGWSSDGSVAYVGALSGNIGVSFWRSFDGGQSWVDRINLTNSGSDKEWLHVDISPTSAHQDNVYMSYHNGNVMQFARSTNMGDSFSISSFGSAPRGIGSDVTTTSNGDVYHFYGAFNDKEIILLKSTNGGASFGSPVTVAPTNGSFDWPIPAMESRRAWIYVAADADRSSGPYAGSVYAAWTDTISNESNTNASANHTRINVYYTRDGGSTWNSSVPHPTSDELTVDRFNQWLTVDENGVVHVVFYDTRHSINRTGVDLYYTFSTDGAQTWNELTRVSSETSANLSDGQEWGDYNGVSVVGDKIIPVWTDNRDGGGVNRKDVFAADVLNVTGTAGFTLTGDNLQQSACAPASLAPIAINVGQTLEFSNPVALSYQGLPAGFSGGFSTNPVTPDSPPGQTTASITISAAASSGDYNFTIDGTSSGAADKSLALSVSVTTDVPGAPVLQSPFNGADSQSLTPALTWAASAEAMSYLVEIDDDPAFGSVDYSATETGNSHVVTSTLETDSVYYWRVSPANLCGDGVASPAFSFRTSAILCRNPALDLANPGTVNDAFAIADGGEISDLDLSINASHSYVGDLTMTLTHEDTGTSVVVIDRPGKPGSFFGCSGDNINVTLDDDAASPVEDACSGNPTISGTLSPNNALAAFNGESLGGTWTLSINDAFEEDSGTLNEWCLQPALISLPDADADGIDDSVDNCTLNANTGQVDTDGDGIGNVCDGDIAAPNDCNVNFLDLGTMKAAFFSVAGDGTWNPDADMVGAGNSESDGAVNFFDLGRLKEQFFGPPGPSAAGCN